jgi:hypothetical protein
MLQIGHIVAGITAVEVAAEGAEAEEGVKA